MASVQRSLRGANVSLGEVHQAIDTANKKVHLSFHWPWSYGDTNLLIQAPWSGPVGTVDVVNQVSPSLLESNSGGLDTTWTGMRIQVGNSNVDYKVASFPAADQILLAQPLNLATPLVDATYTLYKDTYTLPADCDVAQDLMIAIQNVQIVVRHVPRYTFENYALAQLQSSTSMTQFYADTEFNTTLGLYQIRFMPPISTVGEYRLVYRKRPPDLTAPNATSALPEGYDEILELVASAKLMGDYGLPGAEKKAAEAAGAIRLMRRMVEGALIDNQPGYGMFGLPDQTNIDDYFTTQPWAGP